MSRISTTLFVSFLLIAPAARAQTAPLSGTVLDQTGKAVENAAVVIRNQEAGASTRTATDADGRFSANVSPGAYTIEVSAPGFATSTRSGQQVTGTGLQDLSITLSVAGVSQTVTVEEKISMAAQAAPSGNTLEARSAKSEISASFVQNFTSPVADYTEVTLMAPGTFSVSPNGVGLGDSKTFFRGFKDGFYTMTFDGIPFNDTNDPTHHSWAFFPSQWIGGTDFDRSPGTASTIGPANFGGSINLLSRDVPSSQDVRATATYGSFNTRLFAVDYDSGQFDPQKKSSLLIDLHQLLSDGYQTYNYQKRVGGSMKYQYKLSDKTTLTVFTGLIDLWTNTPNLKGPTRAQVAQFGDNYLLSGDPSRPDFYGYNFYHVQTDFEYFGTASDLGSGWRFDNKAYTYRYWNKQNYAGSTITTGTDKLNGYRKAGDIAELTKESRYGVFRTGLWYEWAYTDRYQIPANPQTWADALLPNFHERFITQSLQPFAEYELKLTRRLTVGAGLKLAYYNQNFDQFADNGSTVGNLHGAAFINHVAGYNSWLPSVDGRYRVHNNWSVYAQFAMGSVIPPTSVFDVKNALVAVLPKPTTTRTYQGGSVWKYNRFTLDFDAYYSHFENPYSSTLDPQSGEPVYYATDPSNSKGIEAESTVVLHRGLSLYLNGTAGSARYATSGLWVANAPHDTETIGVAYQMKTWDLGFFNKRVGSMYNDNGAVNQAVAIDPFNITNLYVNYTVRNASYLRGTKIRLSFNNLFDQHNIVGVTPASKSTSAPSPNDTLLLLPGRSVTISLTAGYAPKR